MKNILTKLNIHPSTYVLFLISFLCGYFKPVIILFLIIIVHESGHVITSKLLGYNIISVNIYPFGGITKIDKPLNSSIKKDMLIAISGVLMQLLLFLFIKDPTNRNYNLTIILFNLLPLIPLDGSHLFMDLITSFFSYHNSLIIYYYLSLVFLILFIIYQVLIGKLLFISSVLLVEWLLLFKQKSYYLERFYLERYLNYYPYKQIRNHFNLDRRVLKINTRHFFYKNNHFINEHELLNNHYK